MPFCPPHCATGRATAPLPPAQGTLGRKEVDEDGHGDEDTGRDDVGDIEEGLALDEHVEDDLLVACLLGWGHLVQQHLGWPVRDRPLAVFCGKQAGVGTGAGGGQPMGPSCRAASLYPQEHHCAQMDARWPSRQNRSH